jgi:predicted regulator of Ras-like GTPase activity (Roadblock/LC7/MglB family)
MSNEKALLDVIAKIESDVNGVIATAVVDLESGMTLAAKSNRSDFDLAVASAYNSELVKQKMKIMRALNLKSSLEDMLITLSDQFHLLKFLPGGASFVYLAADRSGTNLAILRNAVNKHIGSLAL